MRQHFRINLNALGNRSPAQRWKVKGTLVETTQLPDPANILPYRRALVENVYRIDRVLEGAAPEGVMKKMVVIQWAVMDGKPLPSAADWTPGVSRELMLEPMAAHPELQSELRCSEHSEFLLPVFFDVNSHR